MHYASPGFSWTFPCVASQGKTLEECFVPIDLKVKSKHQTKLQGETTGKKISDLAKL